MELGRINPTTRTGQEHFHLSGNKLTNDLLSFWQWSSSDVLGNALRGVLAEYIVGLDIGGKGETRELWDAYDLLTRDGVRVEVKSSSYLQSWEQKKYSDITFGIKPTHGWSDDEGFEQEKKRQADVYVFAILAHKDKATVDPLNLSQWEFYVLPTETLNQKKPGQKRLGLGQLLTLEPVACRFGDVGKAIRQLYPSKPSL